MLEFLLELNCIYRSISGGTFLGYWSLYLWKLAYFSWDRPCPSIIFYNQFHKVLTHFSLIWRTLYYSLLLLSFLLHFLLGYCIVINFLKPTLTKYNLHKIKCTHFKHTVRQVLINIYTHVTQHLNCDTKCFHHPKMVPSLYPQSRVLQIHWAAS